MEATFPSSVEKSVTTSQRRRKLDVRSFIKDRLRRATVESLSATTTDACHTNSSLPHPACYTNQVEQSLHSALDLHVEEPDDDEHEVTWMPKIPASLFKPTNGGCDRKVPREEPSGKAPQCDTAGMLEEEPIANQERNHITHGFPSSADASKPRLRRRTSFTLKRRSAYNVDNLGENTIEYDEFPAPSTEERDVRAAFKLISCVNEGTFTIKRVSSRVVLFSDVNGSGNVVEQVLTFDRHRALYNIVVGCDINLKTALSRYMAF